MERKWMKDAVIFELHAKKYPVEAYQEILCEAASCGIEYAVYVLTTDFLDDEDRMVEKCMIQRLEMTSIALDMKLVKAPTLPSAFQKPRIGQVNEFGEVVSAIVGIPSLWEYQKENSKEAVFVKERENRK